MKGKKKDDKAPAYFRALLMIGMDSNTGGLCYFNFDSIIGRFSNPVKLNIANNIQPVKNIDKIYCGG